MTRPHRFGIFLTCKATHQSSKLYCSYMSFVTSFYSHGSHSRKTSEFDQLWKLVLLSDYTIWINSQNKWGIFIFLFWLWSLLFLSVWDWPTWFGFSITFPNCSCLYFAISAQLIINTTWTMRNTCLHVRCQEQEHSWLRELSTIMMGGVEIRWAHKQNEV